MQLISATEPVSYLKKQKECEKLHQEQLCPSGDFHRLATIINVIIVKKQARPSSFSVEVEKYKWLVPETAGCIL